MDGKTFIIFKVNNNKANINKNNNNNNNKANNTNDDDDSDDDYSDVGNEEDVDASGPSKGNH